MKHVLVFFVVNETTCVGDVFLHESKENAEAAGVVFCEELDLELEQDEYGRYCTDDGDPVYQVRPLS